MKAVIVTGINEGYFHNNEELDFGSLVEKIKDISNTIEKSHNVYISVVTSKAVVSYKTEWGCPKGGEDVIKVESSHNPEFSTVVGWKTAFIEFAKLLKKEFKQSTLTYEFIESNLTYLK